jgi:thiol-disulfide isomerase/thioredoxin
LKKITLIFLLIFCSYAIKAAEITFFKGSWKDAVKKATEMKKPLFADFYAEWCGPCKYMSKKVFTDPEVAAFYNSNFISFKIDAENEEPELVNKMSLEGYPTLGYFYPDGTVLTVSVGAMESGELLEKGKQVVQFRNTKAAWAKNPNDAALIKNYLFACKSLNIPGSDDLAKSYLAKLSDEELKKDENWLLIQSFGTDYNSREFRFVVENAAYFKKHGNSLKEYFKVSSRNLLSEAVEQKDPVKAELYKKYFLQIYSAIGQLNFPESYYKDLIDLMYFDGTNDFASFYPKAVSWIETYNMNNPEVLCDYAIKISDKTQDPGILKVCRGYAERAVQLSQNYSAYYALSYILYKSGEKEKAVEQASIAIEKCQDPQVIPYLKEYIKKIKQ